MWQWLVIAPLLAASALYAAWLLAPVSLRLRFARWLSQATRGGPAPLSALAQRLETAALPHGSCDSCPASRLPPRNGPPPPRR